MKKYLAEFVGAFTLTLVVILTSASVPAYTPFLAALTLGLFVYTVGGISGAHLNPAVTAGAWSIKKISAKDAVCYMILQFTGGGAAYLAGKFIWGMIAPNIFSKAAPLHVLNTLPVGFAEAMGAFFLAFGVASVIYGKTPRDASGVVVGGSLLMGIFIASTLSNGILNPAVALGAQSFNLAYLFGPLIGGIAGMWTYRGLSN